MGVRERRHREQAERRRLIVSAARRLAESEGWDALTTRRLAEVIEYSQPVLYQHFSGKQAIITAVAVDGIAELAGLLRTARESAGGDARAGLAGLVRAYVDFGTANPVLYEAMFMRSLDVTFADDRSPDELVRAFGEFVEAVEQFAGGRDVETLSEVIWSGCHGLVTLEKAGRVRPEARSARIDALVGAFVGAEPEH
jgi:AcrR family transcriptional regulator